MNTIKINATTNYRAPIVIGRQRENEVTRIDFDLSGWISTYGIGIVSLSVQRKTDTKPYPVPISINNDGIATWIITDVETINAGRVMVQLTYYVDTKRKKSNIYALTVIKSIAEDGEAPEPYESWLEVLQELTAETAANAESARQSAASAGQSASDAERSMQEAQGHANDASASARNAETSATNAEASALDAEHYADLAGQHATEAGYAFFDVDDSDGELYVEKTDNLNDLDFTVNETTGTLEVVING